MSLASVSATPRNVAGGTVADEVHLDAPSLQRFLDHVEAGRGGTVTVFRPISGGYSRLSALAAVQWADGTEESFVLRSGPPADTGVFVSDKDPGIGRGVRTQHEGFFRPVRPLHGGQRAEPAVAAADRPEYSDRPAAAGLDVVEEPLQGRGIEMHFVGHSASCNVAWGG